MIALTTPEWSSPRKCPISCVATTCRFSQTGFDDDDELGQVPSVFHVTAVASGLNAMSASMIWPTKLVWPPRKLLCPAAVAVVVMVTASVPGSLVKSAFVQTKQIRLT